MLEQKLFEILDRATYIPVLAIKMKGELPCEKYHLGRVGYGQHDDSEDSETFILVIKLNDNKAEYAPWKWPSGSRTMTKAHEYIAKNFDTMKSGDIVDVEFILGETLTKKISERFYN